MSILLGELPEAVEIDGVEYAINYGYRTFVQIEACIFDDGISDVDRILYSLSLFYAEKIPSDVAHAFNALLGFYRGPFSSCEKNTGSNHGASRCYDFDIDGGRIYSAFLAQYAIDLVKTASKELHWWLFKALFDALDETHQISKIMMYRSIDLSQVAKNQKKFYSDQKKRYALKSTRAIDSRVALSTRDAELIARVRDAHSVRDSHRDITEGG